MPEESQVESYEHQDNADIHYQSFPESVSEEDEIYTHYDGCHRHHVKHVSYLSAHLSKTSILAPNHRRSAWAKRERLAVESAKARNDRVHQIDPFQQEFDQS
jgi:hypothetical protein